MKILCLSCSVFLLVLLTASCVGNGKFVPCSIDEIYDAQLRIARYAKFADMAIQEEKRLRPEQYAQNIDKIVEKKRVVQLGIAIEYNDWTVVNKIIGGGININETGGLGDTYLSCAVRNDADIRIIRLLLKSGANITHCTPTGTPLHQACVNNNLEVIALLLQHGADINQCDETWGSTPLMYLSSLVEPYGPDPNTINYLLEHGANVNVANKTGETPLMHYLQYPEIVKLLLAHGANINAVDKEELTVLDRAVLGSVSKECVELLIKNGAKHKKRIR